MALFQIIHTTTVTLLISFNDAIATLLLFGPCGNQNLILNWAQRHLYLPRASIAAKVVSMCNKVYPAYRAAYAFLVGVHAHVMTIITAPCTAYSAIIA